MTQREIYLRALLYAEPNFIVTLVEIEPGTLVTVLDRGRAVIQKHNGHYETIMINDSNKDMKMKWDKVLQALPPYKSEVLSGGQDSLIRAPKDGIVRFNCGHVATPIRTNENEIMYSFVYGSNTDYLIYDVLNAMIIGPADAVNCFVDAVHRGVNLGEDTEFPPTLPEQELYYKALVKQHEVGITTKLKLSNRESIICGFNNKIDLFSITGGRIGSISVGVNSKESHKAWESVREVVSDYIVYTPSQRQREIMDKACEHPYIVHRARYARPVMIENDYRLYELRGGTEVKYFLYDTKYKYIVCSRLSDRALVELLSPEAHVVDKIGPDDGVMILEAFLRKSNLAVAAQAIIRYMEEGES